MREIRFAMRPAIQPKKVVVVGGGVAGMETARVAAMRGHKVSLYEKNDKLGGNLIPGGSHSFKKEVRELNAWYQNELSLLPVEVHTGETAVSYTHLPGENQTKATLRTFHQILYGFVLQPTSGKVMLPSADGSHAKPVFDCQAADLQRLA